MLRYAKVCYGMLKYATLRKLLQACSGAVKYVTRKERSLLPLLPDTKCPDCMKRGIHVAIVLKPCLARVAWVHMGAVLSVDASSVTYSAAIKFSS